MKIYEIGGSVGMNGSTQHHWHFVATKREAEAYIREAKENWDYAELDIHPWEIEPTRAGVAEALSSFIMQTCINEG